MPPPRPTINTNTNTNATLSPTPRTSTLPPRPLSLGAQTHSYLSPTPPPIPIPLLLYPYPLPVLALLDLSYAIRHSALHTTPHVLLFLSVCRAIVLGGVLGLSKRWRRRGGWLGVVCGGSVGAVVWLGCVGQLAGPRRGLVGMAAGESGAGGGDEVVQVQQGVDTVFLACTALLSILEYLTHLLLLRLSPPPRTQPFALRPPPTVHSPLFVPSRDLEAGPHSHYSSYATQRGSPMRPRARTRAHSGRKHDTSDGDGDGYGYNHARAPGHSHSRQASRATVRSTLIPMPDGGRRGSRHGDGHGERAIGGSLDESGSFDRGGRAGTAFGGVESVRSGFGVGSLPARGDRNGYNEVAVMDQMGNEQGTLVHEPEEGEGDDEEDEEDDGQEEYEDDEDEGEYEDDYDDEDDEEDEDEWNDDQVECDSSTSSPTSSISASSIIDLPPPLQPSRIIPSMSFNRGLSSTTTNAVSALESSPVFGPLLRRTRSARFLSRSRSRSFGVVGEEMDGRMAGSVGSVGRVSVGGAGRTVSLAAGVVAGNCEGEGNGAREANGDGSGYGTFGLA